MTYKMAHEPATDRTSKDAYGTVPVEMAHLLDVIPDGVVIVNASGLIVLVNQHTEALFGYNRQALLGKPIEMLMPVRFRGIHSAHRAHYAVEPHVRPMGSGLLLFGLRHDGSEFPVEISLSPLTIGDASVVLGTIRDVTEQRLLEQHARSAVEQRLEMLQAVLDELPTSVYLARGHDAELVLANRRVADVWGGAWQEGQPMGVFLTTSGAQVFDLKGRKLPLERLATVRALRSGQSVYQYREVIRRADGSTLSVLTNAVALDPQHFPYLSGEYMRSEGPTPLVLVVHQDVNTLVEAERLKDEFVALAAHELRNPVASLLGYAQLIIQAAGPRNRKRKAESSMSAGAGSTPARQLRQENVQENVSNRALNVPSELATSETTLETQAEAEANDSVGSSADGDTVIPREWQEEAVTAIMESSLRLAALTDDLLDATRLQANRLELRPEPLDLGALVRRVAKRSQVTTRDHTIHTVVPKEPVVVDADTHRVEQVLTNLLSNAIKYSPDGGTIEISVEVTPEVTHTGATTEDEPLGEMPTPPDRAAQTVRDQARAAQPTRSVGIARVAVRDHGIGIPSHQQGCVFGRFGRADNARERGIAGSGLGLYLSHELIERQGGRLWFESSEGVGTTFTFELPRCAEVE